MDINFNNLVVTDSKYLDYSVTYINGNGINKNDVLKVGESKSILVKVEYKKDITASDLPTEAEELNLDLNINYKEK